MAHWLACVQLPDPATRLCTNLWAASSSHLVGLQHLARTRWKPYITLYTTGCSIMLVLGANFYATVVGNMSLLVSNLNATAARHTQRAEMIQEAMRYLNVSPHMQSRVQVLNGI
jgi:hypothetical protein